MKARLSVKLIYLYSFLYSYDFNCCYRMALPDGNYQYYQHLSDNKWKRAFLV